LPCSAQTAAGRLLRVLLLRLRALSLAAGIERNVVLRPMMRCCADEAGDWHSLNRGQRTARFIVGAGLLLVAVLLLWSLAFSALVIAIAAILGWFGVTHVLAALTAYPGCPELGAVPSLLLRRDVRIGCGPWQWLDARLRLTEMPSGNR
jgi:hypothetical protein